MSTDTAFTQPPPKDARSVAKKRTFLLLSFALVLLHIFFMLFRYGLLPSAPVVSDEVVINDPSISVALGHGYKAESFGDSKYGIDKVYAHFPPIYPYTQALAFRVFGISAYSLRATTTVMSVGSTIVLLMLLYRICSFGLMSWDVALLVQALYCTNASNISLERTARMESMVSLFVVLALYGILRALTLPAERRLPWLLAGGVCGALTIAIHPEAVTAVLLLAVLILFVVPTSLAVRVTSVALFVLTPLVVGVAIYRANFFTAVQQFLAIARDATKYGESTSDWFKVALHSRDVSVLNREGFVLALMLLLLVPGIVYVAKRRKVARASLQYRMFASLGVPGVVIAVLMVAVMQMQTRRIQFLLGTLLVCVAICLWGSAPLRRWQAVAGWAVVIAQCLITGFYLYPKQGRILGSNPDRFMPLIRRLAPGAAVAATPALWLDMKEANRPVYVMLPGLDGEQTRSAAHENPLGRFDVVIFDNVDQLFPWWVVTEEKEAEEGRVRSELVIDGNSTVVYARPGALLQP